MLKSIYKDLVNLLSLCLAFGVEEIEKQAFG